MLGNPGMTRGRRAAPVDALSGPHLWRLLQI